MYIYFKNIYIYRGSAFIDYAYEYLPVVSLEVKTECVYVCVCTKRETLIYKSCCHRRIHFLAFECIKSNRN